MKIQIMRTSASYNQDEAPCKEAYIETEISPYNGATIKKWYIDINSEDVFELTKKYGDIIISCDCDNKIVLEIYDDYRE